MNDEHLHSFHIGKEEFNPWTRRHFGVRMYTDEGSPFTIKNPKSIVMSTKEKLFFFEYCLAFMAMAYEHSKSRSNLATQVTKATFENTHYRHELLLKFNTQNDFSKVKSFGLFYEFINAYKAVSAYNAVTTKFSFETRDYYRNVEGILYNLYRSPDHWNRAITFLPGRCFISIGKFSAAQEQGFGDLYKIADQLIYPWLGRKENVFGLYRNAWEFQRKRLGNNFIIHEIL